MSRDRTRDTEPATDRVVVAHETATEEATADSEPADEQGAVAHETAIEEAEAPTLPARPDGPPPAQAEVEAPPTQEPGDDEKAATRRRRFKRIGVPILVLALIGGGYYIWTTLQRVKITDSTITADTTVLTPRGGGKLKAVYASIGDQVLPHRPVAQVGNELIMSDEPGTVISIRRDLGSYIKPDDSVASLIKHGELKAIGHLKQNKGLRYIHIGQRASVKVYGYGGRKYPGYVEDISEEPQEQKLQFEISDEDERPKYEVKVRILGPAPLLREGMDAKIFVYKD